MAKRGMSLSQVRGLLRNAALRRGWTLCVGAGISKPAFPDWNELVRRLAQLDVEPPSATALKTLQSIYSPDALIQASMDRLEMSDQQFAEVLAKELFSDLVAELEPRRGIELVGRALTARTLNALPRSRWQAFIDLLTLVFPRMTALPLSRTMARLLQGASGPSSILSFNAEPLFPALINAHLATSRGTRECDVIDYVVHATSSRRADRVPYYFCHGLLPVPFARSRGLNSVDKLVFQESSYLQLANTAFSWQSASFLQAAAGNSIVFIGVSLTDPNMRRWLAWVHSTRVGELTAVGDLASASTPHYWIAKLPEDKPTQRWTESLVAHLGVRLVWVSDYSDIVPALDAMTS